MIYYRDRMCYIVLREGDRTVQIAHTVPTNPQIAEELLHMHLAKAYEQMAELIKNDKRRALKHMVRITDNKGSCISRLTKEQGEVWYAP